MTPNAQKLAKALRSGEYEQTRGALRTTKGYCCLGVACELYRQETGVGEWIENTRNGCYEFVLPDSPRELYYLPDDVRAWLGFESNKGGVDARNIREVLNLAALNDIGETFAQIADKVESEPDLYGDPFA